MGDAAEGLLVLVPAAHLLAGLLSVAWAWLLARKASPWPSVVACGVAFCASLAIVTEIHRSEVASVGPVVAFRWVSLGGVFPLESSIELRADDISALLLAVINFVAVMLALHVHSKQERASVWFAPLLSLQLFATNMLLLATDFLQILLFWQLAGVSAFLLNAARSDELQRASATGRVALSWLAADVPLAMGVFLMWLTFGSLDASLVLGESTQLEEVLARNPALITLICFCLLAAAAGRCAQFPLLGWLDGAGQAAVWPNALLQTATLMPGAVYLLLLAHPLFVHSAQACQLMSLLGALTAVMGAWIAVSQKDAFAALSYSTASHLGLVLAALGSASSFALDVAAFHLATHSLIKAALFLAAAFLLRQVSSASAHGNQRGRHRWFEFGVFFVGALLLCSGLLGQNAILMSIRDGVTAPVVPGEPELLSFSTTFEWLCTLAVGMQALALFRTLFFTLSGRANGSVPATDEVLGGREGDSSRSVFDTPAPLLLAGAMAVPLLFYRLRLGNPNLLAPEIETAAFNLAIVLLVVVCTWMFYAKARSWPLWLTEAIEPFGRLGRNRFHVDDILSQVAVAPIRGCAWLCRFCEWVLFEKQVGSIATRLPQLLAHAAEPVRNESPQFYVLSLLVATTSLLMVVLWFQG